MKNYLEYPEIATILPTEALLKPTELRWPKVASGKVREIYDVGEFYLLVASDRLSAFDVILPQGIPGKGIILTQISLYWFAETAGLVANHLVADHPHALAELLADCPQLIPRSMLVRKLEPLKIEAVVRQYLAGSGWKSYLQTGKVFGIPVPQGLLESSALTVPIFTPTSKAPLGQHDEPLDPEQGAALIGAERYAEVEDLSLRIFALGQAAARKAGLLLADTKFEFGTDAAGQLYLIDEVLTPDSSRYWPAASYQPGRAQTSFDKQFVRDYLETLAWDKTPPGPHLPTDVILQTQQRYLEAARFLISGNA